MKKISYVVTCLLLGLSLHSIGQSRKYVSNFSHFQSYFNPGLTGYEGSTVRGFVRNQWAGIQDAPKSYFLSAEFDFGEILGETDAALVGKNSASINLLQESFGAFRETELLLTYASRIRLTAKHNMRLGVGLSYQSIRLDGGALNTAEMSDPILGLYWGRFSNMEVLDFNLGVALTHSNYYFSFGTLGVSGGTIISGDKFFDGYPTSSVIQAGYRESLSPDLSLIVNAIYRSQKGINDNFEFNIKTLVMDRLWLGVGHRINMASNFQVGILTNRIRLGYLYEFPTVGSNRILSNTHEFSVVLNLFRDNSLSSPDAILVW
jgi:type IX secretion system PorP/SprF family membrane protein